MKKFFAFTFLAVMLCLPFIDSSSDETTGYIVIAWNDLGMHCNSTDYSTFAILPPGNNLRAQVIKIGSDGEDPDIVTEGIRVTYEIPGNTYSVGKTNFWDYIYELFDVKPTENVGLRGKGMSGEMDLDYNVFKADGIPITPFTDEDLENEKPYQLALVKVFDNDDNLLAMSQPVIPVSGEIGCLASGCHTSKEAILESHPGLSIEDAPIYCGNCHLSGPGSGSGSSHAKALSFRMHKVHAEKVNDCYDCHPGEKAKCLRGLHSNFLTCQSCHGTMKEIAESIIDGRIPWDEGPSCSQSGCHSSKYRPNSGKLYINSRGHEGIYCNACHGSPHAILPSQEDNDNVQSMALQGYKGPLRECKVCHGITPDKTGPHGIQPVSVEEDGAPGLTIYPNPASDQIQILNSLPGERVLLVDIKGNILDIEPAIGSDQIYNISNLSPGAYFVQVGNRTLKFVKK
jgi:hypothetical protein